MKKYTFLLSLVLTSSYIVCAEADAQSAVAALIQQGKVEYTMKDLEFFAKNYNPKAYFATIARLQTVPVQKNDAKVADPLLFVNAMLYNSELKKAELAELAAESAAEAIEAIAAEAAAIAAKTPIGYQAVPTLDDFEDLSNSSLQELGLTKFQYTPIKRK